MKTKTTKLSVLAFLGLGLVAYGQYDGKVGINIDKPNATLDIKGKTDNTSEKVEGLLIPRVNKEKALLMGANTTPPQESTLVYVNDLTMTSAATAAVADITEKGYYFWNGAKWVKSAGSTSGNTDAIWVKDDVDAKLAYPVSNYTTKYKANGGYDLLRTAPLFPDVTNVLRNYVTYDMTNQNGFMKSFIRSSDVSNVNENINRMTKSYDVYYVDKDYAGIKKYWAETKLNIIAENDIFQDKEFVGFFGNSQHFGNTKLGLITAGYFSAAINGLNASANVVMGAELDAAVNTDKPVGDVMACHNRVRLNGTGAIDNVFASRARITRRTGFNVTSSIGKMYGYYTGYQGLATGFSGTIGDAYDYYAEANENVPGITNKYGVYILGGDKVNHFAGSLGIGTTTPTEKLEVAGKVKATSFVGTNGAAIFPDYVFQKYYTGTSSLKADYSFKTLSQVEDFVKANGHLPGYQSAAEIKKQGYVDLMATQFTNVEKIEELYLHSIEQDKALKSQKEELKAKDAKIAELEARLQKLEALLVK
ncbi:hypothetical protein D1J36_001920 [Riemerella anatipestifer]|uniref:hypothetical protein n=1 Tax=Riemerella anatipestifer TaxID=34085 RepID=UPI0012AD9894|nr:hypothetical protein [Riemerella anatipestifer]USL95890.1 hypothetical protein D1J36_001920 [Riemerella anatipestifer]